jgi:hypothetical protein
MSMRELMNSLTLFIIIAINIAGLGIGCVHANRIGFLGSYIATIVSVSSLMYILLVHFSGGVLCLD